MAIQYYKQGKGHLMKAHSWLLTITVNNNNKIASFPAKAVFGGKRVIAVDNFITFMGSCVSAEYPSTSSVCLAQ